MLNNFNRSLMKSKIYILILLLVPGYYQLLGQGMIIEPNAYVTVAGGGKLIISDATNGLLTIKSTSAGTGSLVVDANAGSTVSVGAHSNVELYLTGNNTTSNNYYWHLVSSPISNGVSGTFFGDYLISYDETTNLFTYIVPTNVPLTPMRGYESWVWVPVGKTELFSGSLNNGSQSLPLTRTNVPSFGFNGWNLLGNPYPCAIDFDAASGWSFGNAETTVWIWNTGSSGNQGTWATHVRGGADVNGGSRYIPAEQGFFLHCTAGTTVTMDNNVRVHNAQSYHKSYESDTIPNILRLEANGNGLRQETAIIFDPSASSSYDKLDAWFKVGAIECPQIYSTINNDTNVAINTLPQITDNLTVPVGFTVGVPGTYSITGNSIETFHGEVIITLLDQKTGVSQKLNNNPVYTFTADTLDDPNRFLVIFGLIPFGTIDHQTGETVQIYSFGDAVFIKTIAASTINGKVIIYDPVGKDLFHGNLSGYEITRLSPGLNTGYYIVKVVTGESVYSKKIFINR